MAFVLLMFCAPVSAAEELELYHADFHARLGQKIYVQVDAPEAERLVAELTSDAGITKTLADKHGDLGDEEVVVLEQRELPRGSYRLTVKLLDGSGETIRQAVREFEKPYDGVPKVGIDVNNAICVDGEPFFPVAPWGISERQVPEWANTYVNALCHVGFGPEHYDIEVWKSYLDAAGEHDVGAQFF